MRRRVPRWRRIPLSGQVRLAIVLGLALLVLFPAYLSLRAFQTPTSVTHRVPVWGWVSYAEWDHTVFFKPNASSGTGAPGPGETYDDSLVEGITIRLTGAFITDVPARIEGWYEVTAELDAGELLGERYLVTPRTPFLQERGTSLSLELELPVDRDLFRRRVEEVAAETGASAPAEVTLTYTAHVEAEAAAAGESVRQVLEPTLVVPLAGDTFAISGDRSRSADGVVRRAEERPAPGVVARRVYSLLGTGVAALLPLLALLGTVARPRPPEDPLVREARRLRRKYRKRIAEADAGGPFDSAQDRLELSGEQAVPLASMEDLARVSDELLKPIVYAGPAGADGPHLFFVVDGAVRYEYRLAGEPPFRRAGRFWRAPRPFS